MKSFIYYGTFESYSQTLRATSIIISIPLSEFNKKIRSILTLHRPLLRYAGTNGNCQYHSMSVRFNATGTHILALRRRQSPVLFSVRVCIFICTHYDKISIAFFGADGRAVDVYRLTIMMMTIAIFQSPDPVAEFYHQDYYNSCTMKSCSFAGEGDQFVLSGSDDFNLYMWKVASFGGERGEWVILECQWIKKVFFWFRFHKLPTGPYLLSQCRLTVCICHRGVILASVRGSQLKFSQVMWSICKKNKSQWRVRRTRVPKVFTKV